MKRRHMRLMAGLAVASLVLVGCASNPPPMSNEEASAGGTGYALGAGDTLRITVYSEQALTGEYIVTPSGKVSFPLIGDVDARSRSIEQVRNDIASRLVDGGFIRNAQVSVEMLNYRPYYILGEVNKPGKYDYTVGMDVQQAVAVAGGFTYRANDRVLFVRRAKGEERTVDLRVGSANVLPGDTIRVGERYF